MATKYTLVAEFAFVRPVAVNAIFIRVAVLQVITVFIVMAPENQVAILVFERVIRVVAIFGLRKLKCDARLL